MLSPDEVQGIRMNSLEEPITEELHGHKRTYSVVKETDEAIRELLEKGISNLTGQELDRLDRLDQLQLDVNQILLTFTITC